MTLSKSSNLLVRLGPQHPTPQKESKFELHIRTDSIILKVMTCQWKSLISRRCVNSFNSQMKRKSPFLRSFPEKFNSRVEWEVLGNMLMMAYSSIYPLPHLSPGSSSQKGIILQPVSKRKREIFQLFSRISHCNIPNIVKIYLELNLGLRPTILKGFLLSLAKLATRTFLLTLDFQ